MSPWGSPCRGRALSNLLVRRKWENENYSQTLYMIYFTLCVFSFTSNYHSHTRLTNAPCYNQQTPMRVGRALLVVGWRWGRHLGGAKDVRAAHVSRFWLDSQYPKRRSFSASRSLVTTVWFWEPRGRCCWPQMVHDFCPPAEEKMWAAPTAHPPRSRRIFRPRIDDGDAPFSSGLFLLIRILLVPDPRSLNLGL